ncbi:MAG: hypothetical protein WC516_08635 [Patescibacteria group bacterium]
MDWIDKLVFSRVQIDKRAEKPWYYTGIKTFDMVMDLVPVFVAVGLVMRCISEINKQVVCTKHLVAKKPKKISKVNLWWIRTWWSIRNKWFRINTYWFGEPLK